MNRPIQYLNLLFESDENTIKFHETFDDFFPAIIYVFDVNNKRISYLNNKVTDLLGYTLNDYNNSEDPLSTLVYKEDINLVKSEFQKILFLKDNESHTFRCRLNHNDNSWRLFKTVARVFRRDSNGNPLSLLCIAEDATDQLRKEEEVSATRQLFDETEALLQFGTWSWQPFSQHLEWTDGMYAILEYSRNEVEQVSDEFYKKHITAEYIENYDKIFQIAVDDKKSFEFEYVIKTKHGREKFVHTKGKVIVDADGNLKKIIGITHDITTKKNSEKARERIIRELNRSNRELEEFAYVASHDLHEPLRKILTFCERLKSKVSSHFIDEGKVFIDRIQYAAENMRTLIDNLLEFSKTTRGSRSYTKCDIHAILNEVISDQELKIEETGTLIKLKTLPVIEAVSSEMRQLFNNLVSNALKFRKKSESPVLTITCKKLNHREKSDHFLPFDQVFYQINVQDNGIGFESIYGEKIFEIFQRLHGKAEYTGSGIGLSICKKIVDAHEGIIFATSEPGVGSVFSVILPERQFH